MGGKQTYGGGIAKIGGVTGVVLAGGISSRMGRNKALLPYGEGRFIDAIQARLALLFDEVLVVTNHPADYAPLPCRMVPDIYRAMGSFAGIHSGLVNSTTDRIFVVACDMPHLSPALITRLCEEAPGYDAVVPAGRAGHLEPLHAVYGRSCIPVIETLLNAGRRSILDLFDRVRTRIFTAEEIAPVNPDFSSFHNFNTPDDLTRLRLDEHPAGPQQ